MKFSPKSKPTVWEVQGLVTPGRKSFAWERLEALKARYRSGAVCFCVEIDSVNNAHNIGQKLGPRARRRSPK